MKNEICIYENGIMKEQFDTDNCILIYLEDNEVRCYQNLEVTVFELQMICCALLKQATDLGEEVAKAIFVNDVVPFIDTPEDEEPDETKEYAKAEELDKVERVEMTPEIIEAIIQQTKQTDTKRPLKATVGIAMAKKLSSLKQLIKKG